MPQHLFTLWTFLNRTMCVCVYEGFAAAALVSVQTNGHNKAVGSNEQIHLCLWTQRQTQETQTMTKRWDETEKSLFFRKRGSLAGAALQAVGKGFFFNKETGGERCRPLLCLFNIAHVLHDSAYTNMRSKYCDEIHLIHIIPATNWESK